MQKNYECVLVLDPAITEEEKIKMMQKIKDAIVQHKGEVEKMEEWGKRELAYPIKKKKEGLYCWIALKGGPEIASAAEATFRLNERSLRLLMVVRQMRPEVKTKNVSPKAEV